MKSTISLLKRESDIFKSISQFFTSFHNLRIISYCSWLIVLFPSNTIEILLKFLRGIKKKPGEFDWERVFSQIWFDISFRLNLPLMFLTQLNSDFTYVWPPILSNSRLLLNPHLILGLLRIFVVIISRSFFSCSSLNSYQLFSLSQTFISSILASKLIDSILFRVILGRKWKLLFDFSVLFRITHLVYFFSAT